MHRIYYNIKGGISAVSGRKKERHILFIVLKKIGKYLKKIEDGHIMEVTIG